MGRTIKIAGVDPALKNVGIVRMALDLDTLIPTITDMHLIQTDKQTGKVVRQNSDDLRRAREIHEQFHRYTDDCTVVFAEVPSGAQSARPALSFGVAIGILASCVPPLIEVQPAEAKLAAVGTKTASKHEMIEWATTLYPNAPWLRARNKPTGAIINDNEHLADGVAIVHAGLRTAEFKRLITMWRATTLSGAALITL